MCSIPSAHLSSQCENSLSTVGPQSVSTVPLPLYPVAFSEHGQGLICGTVNTAACYLKSPGKEHGKGTFRSSPLGLRCLQ